MDVLAHALFTLIFFWGTEGLWWAVFFSVIVDAIVFVPIMISMLLRKEKMRGPPMHLTKIEKNFSYLYNLTHSLLVFALVFGLVWIIRGAPWLPLLAWLLHILVDIPTHSRKFYPTPIFWPFSKWTFDGWGWATPKMLSIIYGGIVLLVVLRFLVF